MNPTSHRPLSRLRTATAVVVASLLGSPVLAHPEHDHPTTRPTARGLEDPSRFHTNRENPVLLPVPAEEDAFTFVVFGDRTGGPDEGVLVLADAVRDTNLIGPDLVMTVGDLVQGYNETPEWQQQAEEFTQIMNGLNCPWFPVAGNHDVYWRDKDGSGDTKPVGEHESNYEMHFGPLWYAFEHKNSWFVVLYSDEGNLETGQKTLHDAEAQRMSPQQFDWLRKTLRQASDAEHIFVFLHHPRWAGNKTHATYGDDWEKVHKVLADAGNVSAVFAGHIHHMRYDGPRDGIEYFALATVGGGQSGTVPRAGFLHQYNLVTVRKDDINIVAIPVGAPIDPRSLTPEVTGAATAVAAMKPEMSPALVLSSTAAADAEFETILRNPTEFPIEVTLAPGSRDSNWIFSPNHNHGRIGPGESRAFRFAARRIEGPVDESFALPELSIDAELLTEAARFPIPTTVTPIPANVDSLRNAGGPDRVLSVDGESGHLSIASTDLPVPDGPMTLEAWMRAEHFGDRVGLVTKAQSSDYGIFVSRGRPSFSIYLGDGYVTVRGKPNALSPGRWHHVAGVYDGKEVRLYIDGQLVAAKAGHGPRKTNDLPLIIGGDVGGGGRAMSFFTGEIDDLRLSATARYTGDSFEPVHEPSADDQTLLLMNMDDQIGGFLFDDSSSRLQVVPQGGAKLVAP